MNARDAYSTKELAELLRVDQSNIIRRAKREGWNSRPRKGRGGGHEWLLASMPELTRAAIGAALAERMAALPAPGSLSAGAVLPAVAGAALPAAGQTRPADIAVPEWSWDKAKARYQIWAKWREHTARAKKRGVFVREATPEFLTLYASGLAVAKEVSDEIGAISLPTLYLWDKKLRAANGDVEALADKRGGWLSGRPKGAGQIGEEAEKAFLAVYLRRNQPSRMFAYTCMKAHLEQRGLAAPSYSSVCRYFERFDAAHHDLVVWMREGEKAYRDTIGKYLSRNDKILQVGDVLVADGHKMNFLVLSPKTGKPCRMTLIGWQDWASRMFVGFDIMISENTQAISSSFFNAIRHLGKKPGSVYLDNGRAFKNKYFDGDQNLDLEEFNGLYARLGVSVSHSLPYVARTKIIERWWRDFDQQCAVMLPSYVGRGIAHKPAHMLRGETDARTAHAKEEWYPTVDDVKEMVIKYARWKAMQPHPTRPGTTPWEVFQAGRGPGFSDKELERLGQQFLYREAIHPKRCRFTIRGVEFESDVLHPINKQLTAYYSYSDLSQVYVYDRQYHVCTARPVATYHPMAKLYGTEIDVEQVTDAQKEQARMKNRTRRIAKELAEKGLPQAAEIMQALPFNLSRAERRTPLTLHAGAEFPALEAAAEPELSEAERAELLELEEQIKAEARLEEAYEVPFFSSEREKYEYFFDLEVMDGKTLLPEDEAWMRAYERGAAYAASAGRYEKLRAMLAEQKGAAI